MTPQQMVELLDGLEAARDAHDAFWMLLRPESAKEIRDYIASSFTSTAFLTTEMPPRSAPSLRASDNSAQVQNSEATLTEAATSGKGVEPIEQILTYEQVDKALGNEQFIPELCQDGEKSIKALDRVLASASVTPEAEELAKEIEQCFIDSVDDDYMKQWIHLLQSFAARVRNETVEECAKVIEPQNPPSDWTEYAKIRAAAATDIRQLAGGK
jgi:hypothetical protein